MRSIRQLAAFLLPLLLAGCMTLDDSGPVHSVWRPATGKPTYDRVIYVTTRAPDPDNPNTFTARWDDTPHCGMAETVVPAAPLSDQDVRWGYIRKLHPVSCGRPDAPFDGIAARIKQRAKILHCSSVFLFVHGFHTGFDSAVLRTAQIGEDAQTGCVLAAFSWPGGTELTGYVADVERSGYAAPALRAFLAALSQTGLQVNVLGHSMGVRLSLSAISAQRYIKGAPRPAVGAPRLTVGELVQAAGDVGDAAKDSDAVHLIRAAAPFVHRITIYGSKQDAVLKVSQNSHAGVARLGQLRDPALLAALPPDGHAIDVIDASDAPADSTGHSYYAMSYEVIRDMAAALRGETLAARIADGTLAGSPPTVQSDRRPRLITRLMAGIAPAIP